MRNDLAFFEDLDEWQQDNHYIRSGYVKATFSFLKCAESLRYWHNETINIYSHLLPSLFIGIVVVFYIFNGQVDEGLGSLEKLNFLQFKVSLLLCLFTSALFHLFKSHSAKVSKLGNRCDYFAINILISSSLVSIIVFAFYEMPRLRNSLLVVFATIAISCTYTIFHPQFSTPSYRPYRSLMFILFGLSGVIPIVAACYIHGHKTAFKMASAEWLILEGIFYILGACIYAFRFPERLSANVKSPRVPGVFDIVGHSHQIFHILVVVAAFCHWKALLGTHRYLRDVTLPSLQA